MLFNTIVLLMLTPPSPHSLVSTLMHNPAFDLLLQILLQFHCSTISRLGVARLLCLGSQALCTHIL